MPVLVSLTAEPLTGLIDTAFVARLGGAALAGLGVSTALLSGVFWVFNFLAIGTQTAVARSLGAGEHRGVSHSTGTAVALSAILGTLLIAALLPNLESTSRFFSAEPEVIHASVTYLRIRMIGAPAFLVGHAVFGAFRGLQDMRTPLLVAVAVNLLNMTLDAILIHGLGPVPAFGIAGAAWASMISQVAGTLVALTLFHRWHRLAAPKSIAEALPLFAIGRDLIIRTGTLLLFLMYTTRVANTVSVQAGATHQAIRQVWIFSAFLLDAYATTAQSLLGYFLGVRDVEQARRVATVACGWGIGSGVMTACAMILTTAPVSMVLLGQEPTAIFVSAWWIAALSQPINAVAFVTDGIHWGSGDYRYLRNAMLVASGVGMMGLALVETSTAPTLEQVWITIGVWITLRAAFGLGRIWPVTSGPLSQPDRLR